MNNIIAAFNKELTDTISLHTDCLYFSLVDLFLHYIIGINCFESETIAACRTQHKSGFCGVLNDKF